MKNFFAHLVAVVSPAQIVSETQTQVSHITLLALPNVKDGWMGRVEVEEQVPVESGIPRPEKFKNRKEEKKWIRAQKYMTVKRLRHAQILAGPFSGPTPEMACFAAMKAENVEIARQRMEAWRHELIDLSSGPVPKDSSWEYFSGLDSDWEMKEEEGVMVPQRVEQKRRQHEAETCYSDVSFADVE